MRSFLFRRRLSAAASKAACDVATIRMPRVHVVANNGDDGSPCIVRIGEKEWVVKALISLLYAPMAALLSPVMRARRVKRNPETLCSKP